MILVPICRLVLLGRLGAHSLVRTISRLGDLGRDINRDLNSAHKTRRIEICPSPTTTLGMRHRLARLCGKLVLWLNLSCCG